MTGLARTMLRLHRPALIVWGVFVAAALVCLVRLTEITAGAARAEAASCPAHQGFCGSMWATLDYSEPMGWVSTCVYYSFWAVAAWAGGALIGGELESGTARLAWTQGVSPARWLAAKLTVPALAIALGGALFIPVYRWAWSANRDLMGDDWTFADVFADRGPAVVAYGLCALAVGALTALVLRRSLPAMGVSVAVMVVLNQFLERHREDFWPAVTRTSTKAFEVSDSVWQVENGTVTRGHRVEGLDHTACHGSPGEIKRCLDAMGIDGYYAIYHPRSHFWPMNLVETGILLAVAALATVLAFRLLKRHTGAAAGHRELPV
ncbi:hypothetical protein ACFWOX_03340 [Streptomyces sp. NPDC058467]|uniref:hypothetical protein n=1 Tax=unclassified Streptomyces TaxID=2593676 RepID=UPI00364D01E9